jgi:hypothetical protein
MRPRAFGTCIVALALAWLLIPNPAAAQAEDVARYLHPWSGFGSGSWRQVRVVSETLDESGQVVQSSTAETTTFLLGIDTQQVRLRIVSAVEVGGKKFDAPPSELVQGFHGQSHEEKVVVKQLEAERLTVDGRTFDCQRQQVEITGPEQTRLITISFTDDPFPLVLRRATTARESMDVAFTSTEEVLAVDMPYKVLDKLRQTVHTRTLHKNHKSTTTTLAVVCPDVPGHIVAYWTREVDNQGRLIRRSTMELIHFEAVSEPESMSALGSRLKQRREDRRLRR